MKEDGFYAFLNQTTRAKEKFSGGLRRGVVGEQKENEFGRPEPPKKILRFFRKNFNIMDLIKTLRKYDLIIHSNLFLI